MLERYLFVWLCVLCFVAFKWTDWVSSFDPFVASQAYLMVWVAVAMFAIGWLMPRDEVRQVAQRWPMVVAGTALQYTAMPLLAWTIVRLFALDEFAAIGTIVAGCDRRSAHALADARPPASLRTGEGQRAVIARRRRAGDRRLLA
jgi:BASS family bile acid:Na+ symporter